MTKEELEKEAKEKFEQYKLKDEDYVEYEGEKILMFNREYYAEDEYFRFYFNGYIAGAEPREKRIAELEDKLANADYQLEGRDNEIMELKAQIEGMKAELHHRLVSPSHDDSYCLDKIIGLDRLWQFGKEF